MAVAGAAAAAALALVPAAVPGGGATDDACTSFNLGRTVFASGAVAVTGRAITGTGAGDGSSVRSTASASILNARRDQK